MLHTKKIEELDRKYEILNLCKKICEITGP